MNTAVQDQLAGITTNSFIKKENNKMKRILALVFAVIMIMTCMSTTVFAYDVYFNANVGGTSYTLDLEPMETIGDLKEKLENKGVDFSEVLRLNYVGKILDDDSKTLQDYGITKEATVFIIFKGYCDECSGTGTKGGSACTKCFGTGKLDYLDLEDGDTYLDTKTIDQTYTATVSEPKTNKTKVQVSWKLEDIAVSVTNNKIWNTETLTWDTDTTKTNGATVSDPTAEFNFVNLSSKDVYAKVSFAKAAGFTNEPTQSFTDNNGTAGAGDGIITLGNKATSAATDNTGKVALKLTITDSDFDNVSAGTGTYGTYTVKISANDPTEYTLTFDKQDGIGGTDSLKAVSGTKFKDLAEITVPTKTGYVFEGYYFYGASINNPMCYTATGELNTDFNDTELVANTTLYAVWTEQP